MKKYLITILLLTAFVATGCFHNPEVNQNINENTNTNQLEEIDTSDWKTYRNEELGLSFDYDVLDQYTSKRHLIKQEGNKITLYVEGNNFGHTITVFDIESQSVEEYIKDKFMQGVNAYCKIREYRDDLDIHKLGYVTFQITSEPEESIYNVDCGRYGNVNAVAYFLYNPEIRNKLVWLYLGQDTSLKYFKEFRYSITIF